MKRIFIPDRDLLRHPVFPLLFLRARGIDPTRPFVSWREVGKDDGVWVAQ